MAENHPAIVPGQPATTRQKLVPRYKSFAILESDEPLLAKLPPMQQEILRAQGSYDELAKRFNLPSGTVRSRLHRARAALTKLRAEAANPNPPQGYRTAH